MIIFLHGGAWRNFTKDDFSFVASAFVANGIHVAILNFSKAPAVRLPCVYRKPHMGISESRGKDHKCMSKTPMPISVSRSKPDSVIWLFLARSTSHPVAAQSDCTNIPLAAGGAQEDETILNCGFSGHGFRRFVPLDPPGLTVLEDRKFG